MSQSLHVGFRINFDWLLTRGIFILVAAPNDITPSFSWLTISIIDPAVCYISRHLILLSWCRQAVSFPKDEIEGDPPRTDGRPSGGLWLIKKCVCAFVHS
jgi:hypothetical protein